MSENRYRLSIGLPVYNGEEFLREALDSILGQTFSDFELIISDNGSTDKTAEICREYAGKDSRIRYYRNETNVGAAKNFNLLVDLARAPYFKWMAHDDLHAKEYLEKCIAVLDARPEVVLCHAKTINISEQGDWLDPHDFSMRLDAKEPHVRFHDWVHALHMCVEVFGVIRTDVLRKTALIGAYSASDRNLLAELSLYGPFYDIPEVLFFRREHPSRSVTAYPDDRQRLAWFNPNHRLKFHLPTYRRGIEYFAAVNRAPLSMLERVRCDWQVITLLWRPSVRSRLLRDLKLARMPAESPAPLKERVLEQAEAREV